MIKMSYTEKKIAKILNEHNIKFEFQKKFPDCRDKLKLPFDFYLIDFNICIEYDGAHHFMWVNFYKKGYMSNSLMERNLQITKSHDKIKTEYCKNAKIRLIRVNNKKKTWKIFFKFLGELEGVLNNEKTVIN